jgi:hypothetical protein
MRVLLITIVAVSALALAPASIAGVPVAITTPEAQRAIRIVTAEFRAAIAQQGTATLDFGRCVHRKRSAPWPPGHGRHAGSPATCVLARTSRT